GSQFWADVVITALTHDDGHLQGFAKVTRDISERRTAEQALRESEERFRGSFEAASVGMALVGPDGSLLQVNRALAEMTGWSEAELLERNFVDLVHPDDRDEFMDDLGRMAAAGARRQQAE